MGDVTSLAFQLKAARAEISKLHRQVNALTRTVNSELAAVRRDALRAVSAVAPLTSCCSDTADTPASPSPPIAGSYAMTPVGLIESCFVYRNGTPRQPGLARSALSRLRLRWGSHPAHTTAGLEGYSHVWLVFVFHDNRGDGVTKSKAKPPRLDGAATGIFACRTPHRPNPIGLSLVRLDRVEGDTLHLSGADLIDGTPVLDVKPYLPYADMPPASQTRCPAFVDSAQEGFSLSVHVTERARQQLHAICGPGGGGAEDGGGAKGGAGSGTGEDRGTGEGDSGIEAHAQGCGDVGISRGGEGLGAAAGRGGCLSGEGPERAGRRPAPRPLRFFAGRADAAEAAFVELLRADPRSVRTPRCQPLPLLVALLGKIPLLVASQTPQGHLA